MTPLLVLKHRKCFGRWPRLLAPQTFNEKLLVRMAFDRRPILTRLAGKVEARDYVTHRLGTDRMQPALFGVVQTPADLDQLNLPDQFMMKANHTSGHLRMVTPDHTVDAAERAELVREWLAVDHGKWALEWCYRGVERTVVFEELLLVDGKVPRDLKFFCYDGEPKFIHVIEDRFGCNQRAVMDAAWQNMQIRTKNDHNVQPAPVQPACFDAMLDAVRRLAAGWDFIRVDVFDLGDTFRIGELTNYPDGGFGTLQPASADALFGQHWRMPPWSVLRSQGSAGQP